MARIEKVSAEPHEGEAVCVAYCNNQVFSGGADGKIKIWDVDLKPIRTLDAHEAYIYAMAVDRSGKLYSSSSDGCVKITTLDTNNNYSVQELFRCEDAIQSLYCDGDVMFTGDEKGVVTNWMNDKMFFKYNFVEEVKSLAAEQLFIYTVRDLDVVISEVVSGKSGKYCNRAVYPGKSPLTLLGPIVEGRHSFVACADRTGRGLVLVKNLPNMRFLSAWNLPDCHEMIVNGICGDDQYLYSGGYDCKVKAWSALEQPTPKSLGAVDVGCVVNAICCGANNSVYIAASDGLIRRAKFV